jgi:hypothetical protein
MKLPSQQAALLTDLQKSGAAEWIAVAEIFRRQWMALARRGLIEYRPGGRQHEALLTPAGALTRSA